MGLKENINLGEDAVAEVKRHVQYASNNLRGDRLASLIAEAGDIHDTEERLQARKSEALADPDRSLLANAPFATKLKIFEDAARVAPTPMKLGPQGKLDVFDVKTELDTKLTAIRGRRDGTGRLLEQGETNEEVLNLVAGGLEKNWHTRMIAMARTAKLNKVGNCMEQAAIAFLYLENKTNEPLDYMYFSNPTTLNYKRVYDHAWLVIGRVGGDTPGSVKTWGANAVWCDPWQLREGRVYSIDDLIKKKATNLDANFKLNSAESVDAGLPAVLWRRA